MVEEVCNCRYTLEYSQSLLGDSRTGRERDRMSKTSRLNHHEKRWGRGKRELKRGVGKEGGHVHQAREEKSQESIWLKWLYRNEKLGKGKARLWIGGTVGRRQVRKAERNHRY